MKKNSLLIAVICFLTQMGFSQKAYTISGQVISGVSYRPLSYTKLMIRVNGKAQLLDLNTKFKIRNIKRGLVKLEIGQHEVSYKLDTFHVIHDTTILVQSSLKDVKIIISCPHCECKGFTIASALADIKSGRPKLLFIGGVGGLDVFDQTFDSKRSARKYGVVFHDFGCVPPDYECIDGYAYTVFNYLDTKYGKEWRKDAPEGTLFLDK